MKKLASLLLSAALTVGLLAGCGGGSADTPAPETTTPAESSAPAETTSLEGTTLKVGPPPPPTPRSWRW